VDEPALREGLPLRKSDQLDYLQWSVDAFRLATAGAKDETQIHTHMCYSEFQVILEATKRMDADVISIEAARSEMELLDAFAEKDYPNGIGPGVYDVHSPRVPSSEEVETLVNRSTKR
jgi:5-methyltetrahydropteroyltriglutamate--homocysteine methyltransferase